MENCKPPSSTDAIASVISQSILNVIFVLWVHLLWLVHVPYDQQVLDGLHAYYVCTCDR